ncbi:MAG: hypothetical protein HRU19_30205 [Pseudobacteriovorax sp.]|nr:hypothetical protein [Pseudobacteriovorax sp.]
MNFRTLIATVVLLSPLASQADELAEFQSLKSEYDQLEKERSHIVQTKNLVERMDIALREFETLLRINKPLLEKLEEKANSAVNADLTLVNNIRSWSSGIFERINSAGDVGKAFDSELKVMLDETEEFISQCRYPETNSLFKQISNVANEMINHNTVIRSLWKKIKFNPRIPADYTANIEIQKDKVHQITKNLITTRNNSISMSLTPKPCIDLASVKVILKDSLDTSGMIQRLNIEGLQEAVSNVKNILKQIDSAENAFKVYRSALLLIGHLEASFMVNLDQGKFDSVLKDKEAIPTLNRKIMSLVESDFISLEDKNSILEKLKKSVDLMQEKYLEATDDLGGQRISMYRRMRYLGLKIRNIESASLDEASKNKVMNLSSEIGINASGSATPPTVSSFKETIIISEKITEIEGMLGEDS